MNNRIYLSTFASDCLYYAENDGFGLEIDEFCTAYNMDDLNIWQKKIRNYFTLTKDFVIHAPFNDLVPVSIDPKIREVALYRYKQLFSIADEFKISRIVFHTGFIPNTTFEDWYFEEFAEFWHNTALENNQFEILIENTFEYNPFYLRKAIDEIALDNVGLCFDVGHANCSSKESVSKWIEVFGDKLRHLHIHNNYGVIDDHNPVFEGEVDIIKVFEQVKDSVSATIECGSVKSSIEFLKTVDIIK